MKYIIDIDGVICEESKPYKDCEPELKVINKINQLYNNGSRIVLFTSRWKKDRSITLKWLRKHKVKFHKLILGKPSGDYYIDDKNLSLRSFLK